MFDFSEMYKTVSLVYACPSCDHHVTVEIIVDRPLWVGNQCPRCLVHYPPDYGERVIASIKQHWNEHDG